MRHEKIFKQPRRRWPLPKGRWRDFVKLSRLLPIALILMVVLCLQSCASTKKTQTEQVMMTQAQETRDTSALVIKQTLTQVIPESRAEMAIPVDSLLSLPAGATYYRKSGQARAEVRMRGDTIIIASTCDSIARQAEYYEEMYYRARDALEQHNNEVKTAFERQQEPLANPIVCFALGIIAGVLSTVTIILTRKRYEKE